MRTITVATTSGPEGGRTVALPTSTPDAYARVNRLRAARSATSVADSGSVGMIVLWIDRQSSSRGPVAAMMSKRTAHSLAPLITEHRGHPGEQGARPVRELDRPLGRSACLAGPVAFICRRWRAPRQPELPVMACADPGDERKRAL